MMAAIPLLCQDGLVSCVTLKLTHSSELISCTSRSRSQNNLVPVLHFESKDELEQGKHSKNIKLAFHRHRCDAKTM